MNDTTSSQDASPIDVTLDPAARPFVYSIPSLPAGKQGHYKLIDTFHALAEILSPELYCDIGANTGANAIAFKTRFPHCDVHAFEANPEIYNAYEQRIQLAGISWHNYAITEENGTLPIYIPRKLSKSYVRGKVIARESTEPVNTGKGSLLRRNEEAEYEEIKVPARRLDDLFEQMQTIGARTFLWIDVEGAALSVFKGCTQIFDQVDAIFVELEGHAFWQDQPSITATAEILSRAGFQPILKDSEFGEAQFNVLFMRDTLLQAEIGPRIYDIIKQACIPADTPAAPALNDLTAWFIRQTPIFIPCYNNPSHCAHMLAQLDRWKLRNVVLVDNASTSPEMDRFLDETAQSHHVVRLSENLGPRQFLISDTVYHDVQRLFCITDPDLRFGACLPDDFLEMLVEQTAQHNIGKAGLALDISRPDLMIKKRFQIRRRSFLIHEWEQQFWQQRISVTPGGDPVFLANTDTTFALYDKRLFRPQKFLKSLRIGGRFTVQHMPWYQTDIMSSTERTDYINSQKHSYYQAEPRDS